MHMCVYIYMLVGEIGIVIFGTYRNMWFLYSRISGGEDGVDKNEGSDNLSGQSSTCTVSMSNNIGSSTISIVVTPLESFH